MKRFLQQNFDRFELAAESAWLALVVQELYMSFPHSSPATGQITVSDGLITEINGLILIGLQFLGRRRYQGDRKLFILDGGRQLLAFAALFVHEFYRYGLYPHLKQTQVNTVHLLFGVELLLVIAMIAVSWRMSRVKQTTPAK